MKWLMTTSLWLALAPYAAAADLTYDDLTDDELTETVSFTFSNSLHTMFHEAGHMLVSEFSLPVLGREEDAVDNLATLMLLEARDDVFDQALIDTADSFWLTYEADRNENGSAPDGQEDISAYYGEHGLDLQRAYQVVCLMVGQDPEGFAEAADDYELPQDRRERCANDYEQAVVSWDAVLAPFRRKENQPSTIDYVYERPNDPELEFAVEVTIETGLLELVAETLADRFALSPGITFRATSCGVANAFWSPFDREVTFCYELADYYGRQMLAWTATEREESADSE